MITTCPACERPDCSCPVCNGSGRAQGRGYEEECGHCRMLLVARLRRGLAAWEALAEWGSASDSHRVALPYKINGRWWLYYEVKGQGEITVSHDKTVTNSPTAAATDLATRLGLIPEEK